MYTTSPGTLAWRIVDSVFNHFKPRLGFMKRAIVEREMEGLRESLLTSTPDEEREIERVLDKIRETLNREYKE